jgi:hypothetical protein
MTSGTNDNTTFEKISQEILTQQSRENLLKMSSADIAKAID